MSVRVHVEAQVRLLDDATYIAPMRVIAIPPSSVEPIWDEMRVDVGGHLILRAFDPGEAIVTGAPIPYVTKSGEPYVTKAAEPYVTKVQP